MKLSHTALYHSAHSADAAPSPPLQLHHWLFMWSAIFTSIHINRSICAHPARRANLMQSFGVQQNTDHLCSSFSFHGGNTRLHVWLISSLLNLEGVVWWVFCPDAVIWCIFLSKYCKEQRFYVCSHKAHSLGQNKSSLCECDCVCLNVVFARSVQNLLLKHKASPGKQHIF